MYAARGGKGNCSATPLPPPPVLCTLRSREAADMMIGDCGFRHSIFLLGSTYVSGGFTPRHDLEGCAYRTSGNLADFP